MARIVYLPLDERPVNLLFPQAIIEQHPFIDLVTPPLHLLGQQRVPAPVEELWDWLEGQLSGADYLIVSLELLFYGGLVPSRLHHLNQDDLKESLKRFSALKNNHPSLKIYAFNLIMRVPAHNHGNEEPEYYQRFGEQIFRWGWLQDKLDRHDGSKEEREELQSILNHLSPEIKTDYLARRQFNHKVNTEAIRMAKEGILDFLVIPLDDCAQYGFSAAEQRQLLKLVEKDTLHHRIHIYPGADEVGCTLLCRIFNELIGKRPLVFVRYSSTLGPTLIPRYEDRPLAESVKSQIIVCGAIMVDNPQEADLILMINSPTLSGAQMPSAATALDNKDISYYSFRNLREFSLILDYYLSCDKKVAVADVAFGNGADHELMQVLSRQNSLGRLISFAAWNTPANTLGTVLAHALLRLGNHCCNKPDHFLLDRYVEDWGYQTLVRTYLKDHAQEFNINYYDLGEQSAQVSERALLKLREFIGLHLSEFSQMYELQQVYFPWNRLFEVSLISHYQE